MPKVSQLPAASTVDLTGVVPLNAAGVTSQATLAQLQTTLVGGTPGVLPSTYLGRRLGGRFVERAENLQSTWSKIYGVAKGNTPQHLRVMYTGDSTALLKAQSISPLLAASLNVAGAVMGGDSGFGGGYVLMSTSAGNYVDASNWSSNFDYTFWPTGVYCGLNDGTSTLQMGTSGPTANTGTAGSVTFQASLTSGPIQQNAQASNFLSASISAISKAASAVVTVNTIVAANPFAVGQLVSFSGISGMTQMNALTGVISAIGGSNGAWTLTVNINSSAFTTYTSGGAVYFGPVSNPGTVWGQAYLVATPLASSLGGTVSVQFLDASSTVLQTVSVVTDSANSTTKSTYGVSAAYDLIVVNYVSTGNPIKFVKVTATSGKAYLLGAGLINPDVSGYIPIGGLYRNGLSYANTQPAFTYPVAAKFIAATGPDLITNEFRNDAGTTSFNAATVSGYISNYWTGANGLLSLTPATPSVTSIGQTITGISVASAAVVTISTASVANPFAIGQLVRVSGVTGGMTQINELWGAVTALGGSSGAWTITTTINSSGFAAWSAGGTLEPSIGCDVVLIGGTQSPCTALNPTVAANYPSNTAGGQATSQQPGTDFIWQLNELYRIFVGTLPNGVFFDGYSPFSADEIGLHAGVTGSGTWMSPPYPLSNSTSGGGVGYGWDGTHAPQVIQQALSTIFLKETGILQILGAGVAASSLKVAGSVSASGVIQTKDKIVAGPDPSSSNQVVLDPANTLIDFITGANGASGSLGYVGGFNLGAKTVLAFDVLNTSGSNRCLHAKSGGNGNKFVTTNSDSPGDATTAGNYATGDINLRWDGGTNVIITVCTVGGTTLKTASIAVA